MNLIDLPTSNKNLPITRNLPGLQSIANIFKSRVYPEFEKERLNPKVTPDALKKFLNEIQFTELVYDNEEDYIEHIKSAKPEWKEQDLSAFTFTQLYILEQCNLSPADIYDKTDDELIKITRPRLTNSGFLRFAC